MPDLGLSVPRSQGKPLGRVGSSLDCVVPDLHRPVRAAGHEDLGVVGVPSHSIHCHVVGIIGVKELAGVGFRTLVPGERGVG